MRTIKNLLLLIFSVTMLAGCDKSTYRKTPGGLPYLVYKGSGSKKIYDGNYIKLNISIKVNDSPYYSTFDRMPLYMMVTKEASPYDISELWTRVNAGDSIIAVQMIDTLLKRAPPNSYPPGFKKGGRIINTIKILDVFTSKSAADSDLVKKEKEWNEIEANNITKYLSGKNITTQKTASGAYVQILNPGTGNLIDSGKYVSVNYTGTTFSGKKFDSNTDSTFQHVVPYSFTVNAKQMMQGFDDAIRLMRLGGSARVYVPSVLGYGGRPNPQSGIKPYESLIFDISIVDVKDKAPEEKKTELPVRKPKVDVPQSQK